MGIYIPRGLTEKYSLLNKNVKISLKRINGFYAPVASDGRIYIPCDIVRKESFHQNDIIVIKAIEDNKVIQEKYAKIYVSLRSKRGTKEFICYMDKMLGGKTLLFQINKLSSLSQKGKINSLAVKLLKNMYYAFTDKNSAIIFKGHKAPAIINTNLKLSNLAFYLGAYFADGTKIGNSWAICASTFEQAKYYFKIHNSLIRDSKPEFTISYTNINKINNEVLKKRLAKIWSSNTDIKIDKFRIRRPAGKLITKWNKFGTLIIREHGQILLDTYNTLLKSLIKEIFLKKDKKLAIDFICGVMEGDGSVPAKKRGHMTISSNKNDFHILENILKVAQMQFKATQEGKNKYALRIGALEILKNFHYLKSKIFILYPKRRRSLFERLKTVGTIKFLIGNHEPTSWVKAWLRNNGFADENYKITDKGLILGSALVANTNKAIA